MSSVAKSKEYLRDQAGYEAAPRIQGVAFPRWLKLAQGWPKMARGCYCSQDCSNTILNSIIWGSQDLAKTPSCKSDNTIKKVRSHASGAHGKVEWTATQEASFSSPVTF